MAGNGSKSQHPAEADADDYPDERTEGEPGTVGTSPQHLNNRCRPPGRACHHRSTRSEQQLQLLVHRHRHKIQSLIPVQERQKAETGPSGCTRGSGTPPAGPGNCRKHDNAHHCPGCHNPQSWDFNGGHEATVDELLEIVRSDEFSNVTFTGGDPLYQVEAFTELARRIKEDGNPDEEIIPGTVATIPLK